MPEGRSACAHIRNSSVNLCLNQNPIYRLCSAYAHPEAPMDVLRIKEHL